MLQHPQNSPNVSVKNIQLPEDFLRPKNFGYSLDKWSSKTPRLKSESYHERKICHRFEDYDDNICDVTEILESLESNEESLREESTDRDIEELWMKSERSSEHPVERGKSKKKKKKKTVKYSLSRPASPQTEQVIRVDVSSSIPLGDSKRLGGVKGDEIEDDIDVNGIHSKTWEIEERDLIFRCSQLALARKQR